MSPTPMALARLPPKQGCYPCTGQARLAAQRRRDRPLLGEDTRDGDAHLGIVKSAAQQRGRPGSSLISGLRTRTSALSSTVAIAALIAAA